MQAAVARLWIQIEDAMHELLMPDRALIFRIVHVANLKWIFENGLHCANSAQQDPNFLQIGNGELISRRSTHRVPAPGRGVLSDYVPFYFTPLSPMMYNIKTGFGGITKRPNSEIVVLVSSLSKLGESGVDFIYSDGHALLQTSNFYDDVANLDQIDWDILQNRDFRRDPDDPQKMDRYMAEALARDVVPIDALIGVATSNDTTLTHIRQIASAAGVGVPTAMRPNFYF